MSHRRTGGASRFYPFVEWDWVQDADPFVFQRRKRIRGDVGQSVVPDADSGLFKKSSVAIPFSHILNVWHATTNASSNLHMAVVREEKPAWVVKEYIWRLRAIPSSEAMDAWVKAIKTHVSLRLERTRFCVIVNPKAGKGKGLKIYTAMVAPFIEAVGTDLGTLEQADSSVIHQTVSQKDAMKFAEEEIPDGRFDVIVCVGGDGIVHEVINGLASRPNGKNLLASLPIAVIPAGSGNALAISLFGNRDPSYAAWRACKRKTMAADLMVAHPLDPNGEPVWLFLSVALGWIAYADIHTENWRFMGDTRFTLGVSKKFAKKTRYTCSVATHLHQTDKPANVPEDAARQVVKDGLRTFYQTNYANGPGPVCQNSLASPNLDNLIGTIVPPDRWDMKGYNLISLYAGKLPWVSRGTLAFPTALPNDGYIDLCLLEGSISFWGKLMILGKFGSGKYFDEPGAAYMKVKSFKVLPGIDFTGADKNDLSLESALANGQPTEAGPTKLADPAVTADDFRKQYTFSLDGEKYDPGHGWHFEVHQGLARFVCDENGRYRPSRLYTPPKPVPQPPKPVPQPPTATVLTRPKTSAGTDSRLASNPRPRPASATTNQTVDLLGGPIEPPPPPTRPPAARNTQAVGASSNTGFAPLNIGAGVPPVGPGTGPAAPVAPVQGGPPLIGAAAAAPVGIVVSDAPLVGADASADSAGLPAPPPAPSDDA